MTQEELKKAMSISDDIDKFEGKIVYLKKLKDIAQTDCSRLGLNLSFENLPMTMGVTYLKTDKELMLDIIDLAISYFEKKQKEFAYEFQKL